MHQPRQASCFYPKSLPHLPIRCGTAIRPLPHAHTLFFQESVCCPLHRPSGGALCGSVLHCQRPAVGLLSAARGGHLLDDCLPFHLNSHLPASVHFILHTSYMYSDPLVSTKTLPYSQFRSKFLLILQGNTASLLLRP